MSIIEQIEKDIFTAMKAKESDTVRTLRVALSSIKFVAKEKREELDDMAVIAILQKEIKIRQETLEEAKKAGRDEMVAEKEVEVKLLTKYLPEALSDEELEAIVKKLIAETGAESMKEMGKVMPLAIKEVQGRAPNNKISQVIRKFLAG